MTITQEQRDKERAFFEAEMKRVPAFFEREPMIDTTDLLKWIGISTLSEQRTLGYLRMFAQDFIVEEIANDGSIHNVDVGPLYADLSAEGATYYVDLIKVGLSTLETKFRIAEKLKIDPKHINYAGLKDRVALTSQLISVRSLTDETLFDNINDEYFFVKNITKGKGVVANGDLKGNRFTITIRLQQTLNDNDIAQIENKILDIKRDGFWNYYYLQRFGTPRLLSHWLGLMIFRGQFEETAKTFVTFVAHRELPYFKQIRENMSKNWGNWKFLVEQMQSFPTHFNQELSLITHLRDNPSDFVGALHQIQDQVRLWIYAYDSYLFNRLLSDLILEGNVPPVLPLITSFNASDWQPYRTFLDADGVSLPAPALRNFPFVRLESRTLATKQQLEIHGFKVKDKFAIFSFSLPKGAYATTFLINFFTLSAGLPRVPDLPDEAIDSKKLLSLGSLESTLKYFQPLFDKYKKLGAVSTPEDL